MKTTFLTTILISAVLISCKKDVVILKNKSLPIEHVVEDSEDWDDSIARIYDAFYVDGKLDSLVKTTSTAKTRIKITRFDTYYQVTEHLSGTYVKTKKYVLKNNVVDHIMTTTVDGLLTYLDRSYSYKNGLLDSAFTYGYSSVTGSYLTNRTGYNYDDTRECVTSNSSDLLYVSKNPMRKSTRCYGFPYNYFTPYDQFPYSYPAYNKRRLKSSSTRSTENNELTYQSQTFYAYDFDAEKSELRISESREAYNSVDSSTTFSSKLTLVRYHGI